MSRNEEVTYFPLLFVSLLFTNSSILSTKPHLIFVSIHFTSLTYLSASPIYQGFHTMLCEDGCLLIFRDGVISSSQSSNQLKNRDKDTNTTDDSSPLASPSVSPSTSPHPTNSHTSTQSWGRNVIGSTLDRIMTEDDADGKELQGTFLTNHSDNKEDSLTSASAKLDNIHTTSGTATTPNSPAIAFVPPSHHWEEGIKFQISSLNHDTQAPVTITIGSWNVLISIITTESIEEYSSLDECTHGNSSSEKSADINNRKKTEKTGRSSNVTGSERILQSVRTLLDGHFVYQLNIPEHCTYLSVPPSHMESGSSSSRSSNKETKKVGLLLFLVHFSFSRSCYSESQLVYNSFMMISPHISPYTLTLLICSAHSPHYHPLTRHLHPSFLT